MLETIIGWSYVFQKNISYLSLRPWLEMEEIGIILIKLIFTYNHTSNVRELFCIIYVCTYILFICIMYCAEN